ncbi:MAG TPA: hypothetical protein VFP34_19125 [Microlunatus sp.]|nr:hypothetical protein [Microlunatus sp.]
MVARIAQPSMTGPSNDLPVACTGCGRAPAMGDAVGVSGVPWTWSVAHDGDRVTVLCTDCAREHARSIEAKLDTEWW